VKQAIVALELGSADEAILDYLDFFTSEVPMGAAYFLHVVPKLDVFNTMREREAEGLISNYELNEDVISRMEAKIRDRLTHKNAVHIEFDVREGDPLEELIKDAEDIGADLAVIGQKSSVDQHGILARNLARKVRCNALIIPDQARPQIKKIVVPVDFSENSVKALQIALAIARQVEEKAKVVALNVYDMPNMSVYRVQKSREKLKAMLEDDRREAFRAFLRSHAREEADNIETVLIERIDPGIPSYITNYAREAEADLIVMGAKGHSKVELLLLGSITEKVLTVNERTPVLVVK
jgi:nucleotide-binding universal stress UspA family protein